MSTTAEMNPYYQYNQNSNNLFVLFIAALIIFLIAGFIVQICWNYVLPNVSGLRPISYLQSLALLILFAILFGSLWNRCVNIILPSSK